MPAAVLVGLPTTLANRIRAALEQADLPVADWSPAETPDRLEADRAPGVVVVAAGPHAVRIAQASHRRDADTAVLVVGSAAEVANVGKQLRYAPHVGQDTRCVVVVGDDPGDFAAEIVTAAELAVRRRRHRSAVAAAAERLPVRPPTGAAATVDPVSLLEHAPVGVLLADADGTIESWNGRAVTQLGVDERTLRGHPLAPLFTSPEALTEALATVATSGQRTVTTSRAGPPGARRVLEVIAAPTPGPRGAQQVLVLLHDITERVEAQRQRDVVRDRSTFLAEITAALDSLDDEAIGRSLVQRLVPHVADGCIVATVEEDVTRCLGLAHVDSRVAARWAAERDSNAVPEAVREALRTGGELVADTALTLPLRARGSLLGVLHLDLRPSGRRFDTDVLPYLRDLARRVAIALDNARAYRRERGIALTLQRSLLPGRLPDVESLALAACYRPSQSDSQVGGDWYDVIPLSAGRVGIVIGDVMGRGVHAAAVMGQLRAAVRAYAVMDLPPIDVLRHLDELLSGMGEQIATCVYAVYDPVTASCCVANAGHPPPIVLRGETYRVHLGGGVPLGVGGVPFEHTEVPLRPGELLVLYTDGLVESHDDDIDAGIARLGRGLVPAGDPNVVCDTALRVMGRQDAADDIAMLVVSPRETDQQVASLTIPPDPGTVSAVRARTAELIEGWTTPERMDRASLLVSELVTNAIRHAGGQVRVRMRRGSRTISVEVADNDTRMPRPRRAAGTDEGGRGLQLVDALADRWGVRPTGEGKVVWFELRRDAGEPTGRGSSR